MPRPLPLQETPSRDASCDPPLVAAALDARRDRPATLPAVATQIRWAGHDYEARKPSF